MFYKKEKGFTLLEVIIGVAVILSSVFGLLSISRLSTKVSSANILNLQAAFLLEEGVEAVKILRDLSWQNNIQPLNNSTNYYLSFDGQNWQATTTNVFIDNFFERKFVAEESQRDGNYDLSQSGAIDPETKKINVFVSWPARNGTTTQSIPFYLTNLFKN